MIRHVSIIVYLFGGTWGNVEYRVVLASNVCLFGAEARARGHVLSRGGVNSQILVRVCD